jgi:hypothetical protein
MCTAGQTLTQLGQVNQAIRRAHLGVLRLGDVDEDLGGGVDDVEKAHDGGAVVGDGAAALVVMDELIHAAGPQRGAHGVRHRRARVDVAHRMCLPLRRVCALLQQDDLRLLGGQKTRGTQMSVGATSWIAAAELEEW